MLYYIIRDGNQAGPYPKEVLVMQGLTPETYVWREGMSGWVRANEMDELADLFVTEPPQHPQEAEYEPHRQPGYNQQQGYDRQQRGYEQQNPYGRQNPYGQQNPYGRQNPYGQPNPYGPQNPYQQGPTNWLPWAIVATIIGFMFSCIGGIFGIIGIVQANKANAAYLQGDNITGDAANSSARTMTIIGLVMGGIGLIGSLSIFQGLMPLLTN